MYPLCHLWYFSLVSPGHQLVWMAMSSVVAALATISKKKQGYIDYIILHRNHRCIAW